MGNLQATIGDLQSQKEVIPPKNSSSASPHREPRSYHSSIGVSAPALRAHNSQSHQRPQIRSGIVTRNKDSSTKLDKLNEEKKDTTSLIRGGGKAQSKLFTIEQIIQPVESDSRSIDAVPQTVSSRLSFQRRALLEQEPTGQSLPLFTDSISAIGGCSKHIRVYVDKDIEFTVAISEQLTCGWLLSEVTRRYVEALNHIKLQAAKQQKTGYHVSGGIVKYTKKLIVALKTTDQRESLDYWLTQYERPLDVIQDGDFLIAHFAKLRDRRSVGEICKEDFEQIKVIGRGGFSRVVLARKKDTGRLYAMKIMKKERIFREKKLKPILCERNILESLSSKHPFIIKFHWAFQSHDEIFFVMDVCTGGELFYHLSCHKKLSEDISKFYFAEILLGLEHLHSHDIVYRDIKPENILLDIDGHIRIADFGLSKVIPINQRSYSFCGSPEYMSPEMLACVGHDRRLDIYCLGALLFEMLTGLPPFYDRDNNIMYEKIMTQEVALPNDLPNKTIIEDLISKMLMKEPTNRFQSLSEVKKHPWLSDVNWEDILNKRVQPPIIPSVRESHIDPEYTELPLDFEESQQNQMRGRLSTERRYSYYYESTLQSKRSFAVEQHHQSFFNQFFEKNDSVTSQSVIGTVGNLVTIQVPAQQNSIGSVANESHEGSIQTEDGSFERFVNNNQIENFTFIDVPKEELEVLNQLGRQNNEREPLRRKRQILNPNQIQRDTHQRNDDRTFSVPIQQQRASNQQDGFEVKQIEILIEEEPNSRNNMNEVHDDNALARAVANGLINGVHGGVGLIQQTVSNGSAMTFFDESNQSIAQEYRVNETIPQVLPSGLPATVNNPILEVSSLETMGPLYTGEAGGSLTNRGQVRMTIEEEEEDLEYSLKDSRNDTVSNQAYSVRNKHEIKSPRSMKQGHAPDAIKGKEGWIFSNGMFHSQLTEQQLSYSMKESGQKTQLSTIPNESYGQNTNLSKTPTLFKIQSEHSHQRTAMSPKFSMTVQTPSRQQTLKPALAPQYTKNAILKIDSASKKQLTSFTTKLKMNGGGSLNNRQQESSRTIASKSLSKNSRIDYYDSPRKTEKNKTESVGDDRSSRPVSKGGDGSSSQLVSGRESFNKDKQAFSSENSSELSLLPLALGKLKSAQYGVEQVSQNKQALASKAPRYVANTSDNTKRGVIVKKEELKKNTIVGGKPLTQFKKHQSNSTSNPSSLSRQVANKNTTQFSISSPLSNIRGGTTTAAGGKSFLKIASTPPKTCQINKAEQPSSQEDLPPVPTTTENNFDEEEFKADYQDDTQSRTLKFKSLDILTPGAASSKSAFAAQQFSSFQKVLFHGQKKHNEAESEQKTRNVQFTTINVMGKQQKKKVTESRNDTSADKSLVQTSQGVKYTSNINLASKTPDRRALEKSFDSQLHQSDNIQNLNKTTAAVVKVSSSNLLHSMQALNSKIHDTEGDSIPKPVEKKAHSLTSHAPAKIEGFSQAINVNPRQASQISSLSVSKQGSQSVKKGAKPLLRPSIFQTPKTSLSTKVFQNNSSNLGGGGTPNSTSLIQKAVDFNAFSGPTTLPQTAAIKLGSNIPHYSQGGSQTSGSRDNKQSRNTANAMKSNTAKNFTSSKF